MATEIGQLRSKVSVGMSTILVVENRCQFCFAFFNDLEKIREHSYRCEFRFAETFEASDGKVKFACAVCFDVFHTRADHKRHEQLHKFPGGFPCTDCDKTFLNDLECVQHMANTHNIHKTGQHDGFSAPKCSDCSAFFEQESFLRLHVETDCGRYRRWNCLQCSPDLLTESAYKEHMQIQHNFVFEDDDTLIVPKVENVLPEDENATLTGNFDEVIIEDPLNSVVKYEEEHDEEALPSMMENYTENDIEIAPELNLKTEENDASNELDQRNITDEEIDELMVSDSESNNTKRKKRHTIHIAALTKRKKKLANEKNFKCKYCGWKYFTQNGLDSHVTVHGPDGSLVHKCDCCPNYFETEEERAEHMETVHREKIYCKPCDKTFRKQKSLKAHYIAHHKWQEKIKSYSCTKCAKSFEDKTVLESHEKSGCGSENESSDESSLESDENIDQSDRVPPVSGNKAKKKAHIEPKFVCKYCDKKFIWHIRLQRHLIAHGADGTLVHRCDFCSRYFKTTEDREAHVNAEHEKKIMCEICDKSFRSEFGLEYHNHTIHNAVLTKRRKKSGNEKKFKCKYCGRKYFTQNGVDLHVPVHGPDHSLVYRCDFFCPLYFKTRAEQTAHEVATHKDKLTCNVCGKLYQKAMAAYSCMHAHRFGPQQKSSHVCAKCGKSFTNKSYLKDHEISDCGRAPAHKCDECGKAFASKYSLQGHMRSHTGERNFPCTYCEMRFPDKVSLQTHTRYKHTNERPHKCPHCEKRFVDKPSMKTHMIVHTGIKRYVCYGCDARFPTNSALHKHRNVRKDTCALVPIRPPLPKGSS